MARNKLTRIEKRKRMDALFDKGEYIYFSADSEGNPIIRESKDAAKPDDMRIWVRPASPLQREMVVREAQAARARTLVASKDVESKEWINVRAFVAQLSQEGLVEYVIDLDEADRLSEARREVLKEPEWEDFNSLRDAMRQYEEAGSPKEDPEWESLLKRDRAFGDQVAEAARDLRENAWDAMKLMPRKELEKRAYDKRSDQAGTSSFMDAYELWMLYYACRDDDDHSQLYFLDPDEMRSEPQELQDALSNRLARFVTDAGEAKNSPGAAPSLPSSEPPAEPETSESSSPEESSESTTSPGL